MGAWALILAVVMGLVIAEHARVDAQTPQTDSEYVVAIDAEYAPYEYVDPSGTATGFTVSLLTAIGRDAGVRFRFVPMAWPDAVAGLADGSVDLVNMIQTPERAAKYEFSRPHSQIAQAIFVARDSDITGLDTLAGHTVALQEHDIALEKLAARTDFARVIVHSKEQGLLLLDAGRVDAFFAAEQAGLWLVREYRLRDVRLAETGLWPLPFGFAARKGNTELIALLNSHLDRLKASGEYQELVRRWFTPPPVAESWFARYEDLALISFVGLVALALLFLAWNFALHRAVTQRTAELHASEARYRNFYENVHDVIYRTDNKGVITDISPSVETRAGYRREEVIGRPVLDFFVDPEEYARLDAAMLQEGVVNDMEIRLRARDGRVIFTSITARLVYDDSGRPIATEGVLRDITERKQAEQALRDTNELLEIVFSNTHLMLAYLDRDFNFVRVNRAYAEADERTPDFFPGKNHFDLYPNPENEAIFRRVVETGEPYFAYAKPFEYAEHPERGVTYWDWSLVPVKDSSGQVTHLILSVLNVSERVKALQALRESEMRYRVLAEAAPDMVFVIGAEGSIRYVNSRAAALLGLPAEEARGHAVEDFFPPDVAARYRRSLGKVFRSGEPLAVESPSRIHGRSLWLHTHLVPLWDEDGKVKEARGAAPDVTQRKQMESAL
ncbi:MAG: PAS domain S-box protein, partial [Caldilineae bacterium]